MAISLITEPTPFDEAFAWAKQRHLVPTNLGSRELKLLDQNFRRRALTLARVSDARILSEVHDRVGKIAKGVIESPGTGMDYATFRVQMQEVLDLTGYEPEAGKEGTISDLRSPARLNLIVDTEQTLAAGRANQAAGLDPEVLDAFPAWELVRLQETKVQRDWEDRWRKAARSSGDTDAEAALAQHGRMIARKDSKIWAALGSSALFGDALNTDHPPFAFGSGMDLDDVNRMTAMEVGVIGEHDEILATPDEPQDLEVSFDDIAPQIREVMEGLE